MRKKYPYLEESYTPFSKIPQKIALNYPYIESSYNYNLNEEQEKEDFLSKIDNFVNQKQYVNLTLLDWQENPIKEIQGIISTGSISKDGNSSVRRSANLSCSVSYGEYDIDNIEMDFALNKKIFIEIGIKNETNEYPEYPILWFPQGVFYINSFSINSSTSSAVNLSLNLKDKMCLLNGDIGGKLPATIQFNTMTTQTSDGSIIEQDVLYYNLIIELLNHWGGEELSNIVIQDVPLRIRKIVQWIGEENIYLKADQNENRTSYQFRKEQDSENSFTEYSNGDDVGYIYSDFISEELIASAGETICSVLDKIKNKLGNYEYFYDTFGIFHFREIKNYQNINQSEIVLQETENPGRYISLEEGQFNLDTSTDLQYLIDITTDKTVFSFEDGKNITSINITPNYNNIKNDFVVNGIKKNTSSGINTPIRYRLVIDNKPEILGYTTEKHSSQKNGTIPYYGKHNNLLYYTYPERLNGETILETNKLGKWLCVDELPKVGNMDQIYRLCKIDENGEITELTEDFFLWREDTKEYEKVYLKLNLTETEKTAPEIYSNEEGTGYYYAIDWRTHLLCMGLEASIKGMDPGPYFEELNSFWPDEYDLRRQNQKFFGEKEDGVVHFKTLTTGKFYFDIIDANSSSLGIYSINNIGRRTEVINNEEVNCLFTPEIPNIIFLNMEHADQNWSDNTTITELRNSKIFKEMTEDEKNIAMLQLQKEECDNNWQPYVQISNEDYAKLANGGYLYGAYDEIRYALFCHTTYQKVLSITALPAYYLEPNSRVYVSDKSTNTYGDFMIQNINLTLGPGANMSVTMNEALERL